MMFRFRFSFRMLFFPPNFFNPLQQQKQTNKQQKKNN